MNDKGKSSFGTLVSIGGGILLMALSESFPHMIEWTTRATDQKIWFGISNAVISELMPTASFLYLKMRHDRKASIGYPIFVLAFSLTLSITAQLSSTGMSVPYEKQLLVCLPAIAVGLLSIMIHGEWEHRQELAAQEAARLVAEEAARKQRRAEALAEQETARKQEAERAEIAAEAARKQEAERAEIAAEAARQQEAAREEAERAERIRLAEIEAGERAERQRIEATERAEQRRIAEQRERRETEQRHAVAIEQARIAAEAEAEKVKAQAAIDRANAEARRAELRREKEGAHRAVESQIGPRRMPPEQRMAQISAIVADFAPDVAKDWAVAEVAKRTQLTERNVRNFITDDWWANRRGERPLRLVAGERP